MICGSGSDREWLTEPKHVDRNTHYSGTLYSPSIYYLYVQKRDKEQLTGYRKRKREKSCRVRSTDHVTVSTLVNRLLACVCSPNSGTETMPNCTITKPKDSVACQPVAPPNMDMSYKIDEGYSEETRSQDELDSPMGMEAATEGMIPTSLRLAMDTIMSLGEAEKSGMTEVLGAEKGARR